MRRAPDGSPTPTPTPVQTPAQAPARGLRERKKLATRQALGQAALRLAVERGLDNVTVEDIAAEANVALRTFRNYFATKHEAICALGTDRALRVGTALRSRPAGEPLWEAITHALVEHYDGADRAPGRDWITNLRQVTGHPAMRGEYLKTTAAMQRALAEAIAWRTGLDVDRDLLPDVLAGAVTAAAQVAVRRWAAADPPVPLRPLLQDALRSLASARDQASE